MKMLIERAFLYSGNDKSNFVALTAYKRSVLLWRTRHDYMRTDIDVGGNRMAKTTTGCAIAFSQPSCRTVETRRPGPDWLTTTFEMKRSL